MRTVYTHPLYTLESMAAQRSAAPLRPTAHGFAGAYHGYGFHEDGSRPACVRPRHWEWTWRDLGSTRARSCTRVGNRGSNTFRYRVSYFLLDLDELPQLERRLVLSPATAERGLFRDRDYLDGDGTPLKEAVVRFCAERGASSSEC